MADGKIVGLMETNQIIFRSMSSNEWYSVKLTIPLHVVQDLQSCHKIKVSVCHFATAHRRLALKCDVLSSSTTKERQKHHNGFPTFIKYGSIYLRRSHYIPWLWVAIAQSVYRLRYGVNGPGIQSQWGRDFPHPSRMVLGSTQTLIQWVPVLSRG
jgi:hypothetical protein